VSFETSGMVSRSSVRARPRGTADGNLPAVVLALAAYVFVVISRVSDEAPSLRLALVTAVLTTALVLLRVNADTVTLFHLAEVRAVLALLALSALTIPFSAWPGQSFAFVTGAYAKIVFFFLVLVLTVRSMRSVKAMVWALFLALLSLEVGLVLWGTGARPEITQTYDANDLGFVMVTGFPLAAMWAMRDRSPLRYLAGLIAALAVVTVIMTRSRGAFVGLCVVLVMLMAKMPRRRRRWFAALVVVAAVVVALASSDEYWDRIATIWADGPADSVDYDQSGVWGARVTVWQTALELMVRNAVLGVGAGVYDVAEGLSHGGSGKWAAAHNSFLQIGAELGLVGLGLFIFLIYRAAKNCCEVSRRAQRDSRLEVHGWIAQGLQISLWGYVITGFCLSQAYSNLLYALVGVSVALLRLTVERGAAEVAEPAGAAANGRHWWRHQPPRALDVPASGFTSRRTGNE
jgi:O-antigen ligase